MKSARDRSRSIETPLVLLHELGVVCSAAWKRHAFCDEALPEVALESLNRAALANAIAPADIDEWVLSTDCLPPQASLNRAFGEPPITVFDDGQLRVEILFWESKTTAVHAHAFTGAFYVLAGASIHASYRFELETRINDRLMIGDVALRSIEHLSVGDARPIDAALKHALFHLDAPSVTLVVRGSVPRGIEHEYLPPYLAVDPQPLRPAAVKRIHLLEMLLRSRAGDSEKYATRAFACADLHETLLILRTATPYPWAEPMWSNLVDAARARHGAVVDRLVPSLLEDRRRSVLAHARVITRTADARLVLAALLHVPERDEALSLARQKLGEVALTSALSQLAPSQ